MQASDWNLPGGPFKVCLCDPPWRFASRPKTGTRFGGGAEEQYNGTLTFDDLLRMPVREIMAPDSLCFLWSSWPVLWEDRDHNAFALMEAWGYRPVTLAFLWVKVYEGTQRPRFGQGYYMKSNSEPCFLGVRGKPWKQTDKISQIIEGVAPPHEVWEPVTRHSEKPNVVRQKIVEFCGDVPRVELFSRHKEGLEGFTMWGNQAGMLGWDSTTEAARHFSRPANRPPGYGVGDFALPMSVLP